MKKRNELLEKALKLANELDLTIAHHNGGYTESGNRVAMPSEFTNITQTNIDQDADEDTFNLKQPTFILQQEQEQNNEIRLDFEITETDKKQNRNELEEKINYLTELNNSLQSTKRFGEEILNILENYLVSTKQDTPSNNQVDSNHDLQQISNYNSPATSSLFASNNQCQQFDPQPYQQTQSELFDNPQQQMQSQSGFTNDTHQNQFSHSASNYNTYGNSISSSMYTDFGQPTTVPIFNNIFRIFSNDFTGGYTDIWFTPTDETGHDFQELFSDE